MRSYKTSFFTILLLFLLSTGCSGQLTDANIVAFKNVNLVPMDSAYILADQTILIQDGIIREIGPASNVAIPEKAQIIEGKGAIFCRDSPTFISTCALPMSLSPTFLME